MTLIGIRFIRPEDDADGEEDLLFISTDDLENIHLVSALDELKTFIQTTEGLEASYVCNGKPYTITAREKTDESPPVIEEAPAVAA